jgi:hypothetical protein
MNIAIFISRGNTPQRHREHGGFFWVPEDTLPGGSGVARLFALQYIHPQAITTNRRRISKRDQTRTTAQQTFFSPADLGALCASVVKSSSSATSSHALRRVRRLAMAGRRARPILLPPRASLESTIRTSLLASRPIHRTRAAGNSMTASAFGCSKSGSF